MEIATVPVRLLWFAHLRDVAGREASAAELPAETSSTAIIAHAAALMPAAAALLSRCRVAVDCAFISGPIHLRSGSDIAIIPPVSGG